MKSEVQSREEGRGSQGEERLCYTTWVTPAVGLPHKSGQILIGELNSRPRKEGIKEFPPVSPHRRPYIAPYQYCVQKSPHRTGILTLPEFND